MVKGFLLWYYSSYFRYNDIVPFLGSGTLSCSAGRFARPFTLTCLTFQLSATLDSSAVSSSLRANLTVLLLLAMGGSSLDAFLALREKL